MPLKNLEEISTSNQDQKLIKLYNQVNNLLDQLNKQELTDSVVQNINEGIDKLSTLSSSQKKFKKELRKFQMNTLTLVEKELKLVTKRHYTNLWLAIGMTAFGIPFGVALGSALGNMAYIGLGLPIGILIGIAVGRKMDKKAIDEGRVLNIEIS